MTIHDHFRAQISQARGGAPAPADDALDVEGYSPDDKVEQIQAYVEANPDFAAEALDNENQREKPRTTLVTWLEERLA